MNKYIDYMPCGFLTLSKDGEILTCNETLSVLLEYEREQLVGKHLNYLLTKSTKMFIQLYFFPLIMKQQHVEEMYLSLTNKSGEEIPVLMNASIHHDLEHQVITCVMMPVQRRDEYENQLLVAKKTAEDAVTEKDKANTHLEKTIHSLQKIQQQLLQVNKENQRFKTDIQKELNLAKKIQEQSLTSEISNEDIEIDSYYQASRELSGDNYGFYQINNHQYGAILLDVMGNGISSALISMSLHPLFQRLITKGFAANIVIEELDNYLHGLFHNNQDSWHYCTAIYLVIDTNKRTVQCTNAGHPAAILQDSFGIQQEFPSTSPPIGAFEDMVYKTTTYNYDKDSRILLYTDGVSEPIGEEKLRVLLKESVNDSLHQVKEKLLNVLEKETDNEERDDDQCFILMDLK